MASTYQAPDLPPQKVTPVLVRDELLKCFESANREFARLLNQPVTEEALKAQVQQFVNGAFQKCGVSFENPSKAGIVTAINECKKNAESTMGPQGADIVRHHYDEMMTLIKRLPG